MLPTHVEIIPTEDASLTSVASQPTASETVTTNGQFKTILSMHCAYMYIHVTYIIHVIVYIIKSYIQCMPSCIHLSYTTGNVDGEDNSQPREGLHLPHLSREEAVNEDQSTREGIYQPTQYTVYTSHSNRHVRLHFLPAGNGGSGSPSSSAPPRTTDSQTATTPGGGEFSEMISIGGESLGSMSEFETVSFTDETGQCFL